MSDFAKGAEDQSPHETGHAIGLFRKQMHPDRDRFVRVLSRDIQSGNEHNSDKESWHIFAIQGLYYASIMHYGKAFLCKNRQDTLHGVFGGSLRGSTDLTFLDTLTVNRIYECPNDGREGRLAATALQGYPFPTMTAAASALSSRMGVHEGPAVDEDGRSIV